MTDLVEWLRKATLDPETHQRLYDDARPDLYVSDVREVIAEIKRLTAYANAATVRADHWQKRANDHEDRAERAEAALREVRRQLEAHLPSQRTINSVAIIDAVLDAEEGT